MKDIKICLSIRQKDEAFDKLEKELSKYADVEVVGLDGFSLKGVDIFIGKKLSPDILKEADRLKAIFAYKTGVDDFPIGELKQMGVSVYNSHADSKIIAEYALGLAVSLVTRICEFDRKLRCGIWYDTENRYWKSMFEMKVGLLGYGHIGKYVHAFLKNNGIQAYTLDRGKEYKDIETVSTVEDLVDVCDIIILSLPKTPKTDNMFGESLLRRMKGKFIVNVGRSNVIDQKALYELLSCGHLAGAAIDTWDEKPKNENETLMPSIYGFERLNNVILSPHAAMNVESGHSNYVEDVTNMVKCYIRGENVKNEVDLERGY